MNRELTPEAVNGLLELIESGMLDTAIYSFTPLDDQHQPTGAEPIYLEASTEEAALTQMRVLSENGLHRCMHRIQQVREPIPTKTGPTFFPFTPEYQALVKERKALAAARIQLMDEWDLRTNAMHQAEGAAWKTFGHTDRKEASDAWHVAMDYRDELIAKREELTSQQDALSARMKAIRNAWQDQEGH